jgi:DNA-directed RNA polymerase subunit RPC12/RpoP
MSHYLLPCTNCEAKIPVTKSQAGMLVECSGCSTKVEVPTIRALSQLELAPVESTKPTRSRPAGPLIGILASALFLVGVSTLSYGGYLYWLRQSVKDPLDLTEEDFLEDIRTSMSELPPVGAWDAWNDVSTNGITDMPVPPYFLYKRMFDIQRPKMLGCLYTGTGCLIGFVGCLFLSRKRK